MCYSVRVEEEANDQHNTGENQQRCISVDIATPEPQRAKHPVCTFVGAFIG